MKALSSSWLYLCGLLRWGITALEDLHDSQRAEEGVLEGLITSCSLPETFVIIGPEPQRSWWPRGFLMCLCPWNWAAGDPREG